MKKMYKYFALLLLLCVSMGASAQRYLPSTVTVVDEISLATIANITDNTYKILDCSAAGGAKYDLVKKKSNALRVPPSLDDDDEPVSEPLCNLTSPGRITYIEFDCTPSTGTFKIYLSDKEGKLGEGEGTLKTTATGEVTSFKCTNLVRSIRIESVNPGDLFKSLRITWEREIKYNVTVTCKREDTGAQIQQTVELYTPADINDHGELVVKAPTIPGYDLVGDSVQYIDVDATVSSDEKASFKYAVHQDEEVTFKQDSEYASYCPIKGNVQLPANVAAYYCSSVDYEKGNIILQRCSSQKLAYGEGVLLRNLEHDSLSYDVTVTIPVTTKEAEVITSNKMKGVTKEGGEIFAAKTIYVYGKSSRGYGYGWNSGSTRKQGTSYIPTPETVYGAAPELKIIWVDDNVTDIDSAVTDRTTKRKGDIYNLMGAKVSTMAERGVYIKDGKKILVNK